MKGTRLEGSRVMMFLGGLCIHIMEGDSLENVVFSLGVGSGLVRGIHRTVDTMRYIG